MALHSLLNITGLKDPLKQFQVRFVISMVPALALAIAQQKAAGLLSGNFSNVDAQDLELRCTSFTYPGTKIAQSSMTIGSFRRKLGTLQNRSGIWECKITEDQNGAVMNTIQSWCDLIHNPFTGVRLPSATYVTTCLVDILSADKDKHYGNKGRRLFVKGFYPIEYSVGQIDASSSNPVEVTVKFNYDWWSETMTGISDAGAAIENYSINM